MKIIDITRTLSTTMDTYTSLPALEQVYKRRINETELVNLSWISMNTHIGTHLDVPYHFIKEGRKTQDVNVEELIGKAQVIDVTKCSSITREYLENFPCKKIMCFKFGESRRSRLERFFEIDAIDYLIENHVKVIGSDIASIDCKSDENMIHKHVFKNDLLVITSLELDEIAEGEVNFMCLPLKRDNAEGTPCRAVIIE